MGQSKVCAEQIIEKFYDGVVAQEGWVDALSDTARLFGSAQALIMVRDRTANTLQISENYAVPAEVQAEYNAYYYQHDPAIALSVADAVPIGGWYYDRRDVGADAIRRSEFYQVFMRQHRYSCVIANRVLADDRNECFLSMQRLADQPAYTEEELSRVTPLLPHLQRAIRLRSQMQRLAERAGVAERALDQLRVPLVVADDSGRVLLANAEADALLRARTDIATRHGRLWLRDGQPGKLERLLRQACGRDGPAVAGELRLQSPDMGALQLVVTPLPARMTLFHAWGRPLALVLLQRPASPREGGDSLLRSLYQLTPAEARLALRIVHGATPAQAAAELGTAVNTVRSQLKSIFLKTGTTRQADLVRILSGVLVVSGPG